MFTNAYRVPRGCVQMVGRVLTGSSSVVLLRIAARTECCGGWGFDRDASSQRVNDIGATEEMQRSVPEYHKGSWLIRYLGQGWCAQHNSVLVIKVVGSV